MHDLAKEHPEKVEEMKKLFLAQAEGKQSLPHRRRHLAAHPSRRPDQIALHELDLRRHHHSHAGVHRARHWATTTTPSPSTSNAARMPAACSMRMGGSGGGLTCYMDKGHLIFEYNLMIIDRSIAKSAEKIAPGKHTIVVDTTLKAPKPGAPADIVLSVDGKEVARTTREDDRARRLHRQRKLRRRHRPRLTRLPRLLRTASVQVRRQDREGDGRIEMISMKNYWKTMFTREMK